MVIFLDSELSFVALKSLVEPLEKFSGFKFWICKILPGDQIVNKAQNWRAECQYVCNWLHHVPREIPPCQTSHSTRLNAHEQQKSIRRGRDTPSRLFLDKQSFVVQELEPFFQCPCFIWFPVVCLDCVQLKIWYSEFYCIKNSCQLYH